MFKKFILELAKPSNHLDTIFCEFDIRNTEIAQKWANEINQNYQIYERDRFTNWPNNGKDNEFFSQKLNEQIDVINKYYPGKIELRADPSMDQKVMNELHVFFEQLRGPVEQPLEWYLEAPLEVKTAIERFNIYIHEYEDAQFNKEWEPITNHPYAMIIGTYHDRPRYELEDTEYKLYTYRWTFGTVYLNYCVVGKPLLDVFRNQDEDIGNDNIRPQHHWAADWMIKFGPDTREDVYKEREKEFWDWFARKENFFNSLGIYKGPKMALGQIPVADINKEKFEGLSDPEIIHKLSPYLYLKSTRVE